MVGTHVAAEVIAGELMQGNEELAQKLRSFAFNARVIPSVAYTDPEVAWVGLTEDQAKAQGINVKKGLFPWTASDRTIANGRDEGVTKLLFDDSPEAHGRPRFLAAVSAQTAVFNEVRSPQNTAILGLMRLNFLSVCQRHGLPGRALQTRRQW